MIRKIFLIALLVMFAMNIAAFAGGPTRLSGWQYTLTKVLTNSTGASVQTLVPVTTIVPADHGIIGWRVTPYDVTKNSEFVVGLCDAATVATALDTTIFDEAEKSLDTSMDAEWYPYPKRLTNGLVVRQGANTFVTIYYELLKGL